MSYSDVAVDSRSNPQCLLVWLRHSKTDPFGVGVTIALGCTGGTLCPVASVLAYLAIRRNSPGPLFGMSNGSPLTRSVLMTTVREALTSQGIDTSLFTGHSFILGAATAAAAAGLNDSMIQQLGGWNSSAYLSYIRPPTQRMVQHLHS